MAKINDSTTSLSIHKVVARSVLWIRRWGLDHTHLAAKCGDDYKQNTNFAPHFVGLNNFTLFLSALKNHRR
jgi:hypothetical protein